MQTHEIVRELVNATSDAYTLYYDQQDLNSDTSKRILALAHKLSSLSNAVVFDTPITDPENVPPTEGSAYKRHPCPHCGAEDNLRCCEFGRDQ